MTRIVFMGTPDFSVPALQSLIRTGMVVGVVTQPDRPAGRGNKLRMPPVKVAALEAELPVFQPLSLRKEDAAQPIREWEPDLIIVAAFGQILKPHLLDFPRLGCVNIHASLLPRWRGAAPIQAAILHGDGETGITLMQMDEGLDTGDMLVAEQITIGPDETASQLHDRLAALGGEMMTTYLPHLIDQSLIAVPQDDALSTYAPRINKGDGAIDWGDPAPQIDRQLRAMNPWPGTFTHWESKQLKIRAATISTVERNVAPGTVFETETGEFAAQTGAGSLILSEIQLQGKKSMSTADFVRGRPEFVGARLETMKDES